MGIDVSLYRPACGLDGIADSFCGGHTMCNGNMAVHTEQRGATSFFVVGGVTNVLKRRSTQKSADLRHRIGHHFSMEKVNHRLQNTLAHLEHNVSNKSVTHNAISLSCKEIMSFHIPNKIEICVAENLIGFFHHFGTLGLLLADIE